MNQNLDKKGKTYEEIYGVERAKLEKEKRGKSISKTHKKDFSSGKRVPWNKRLTKENDERVKRYAENLVGKKRIDMVGEKNPMKDEEIKNKNKRSNEKFMNSEEGRLFLEKQRERYWDNPKWIEQLKQKIIPTLRRRPTSYEKKISELCIDNNLPFIYTGDGTFLIGHKNPDFKHKNLPVVIEVYEEYFKIAEYGSCEEYENQRANYFAKYGYKTIFIKMKQKDNDWSRKALNKINNGLMVCKSRIK